MKISKKVAAAKWNQLDGTGAWVRKTFEKKRSPARNEEEKRPSKKRVNMGQESAKKKEKKKKKENII